VDDEGEAGEVVDAAGDFGEVEELVRVSEIQSVPILSCFSPHSFGL